MKIENSQLIDDLLKRMERSTEKVRQFEQLSLNQLRFKNGNQWSILECLEHLNLYGDFYLVEIENQLIANRDKTTATTFRSGMVGNYFAKLMEVKDGKLTKMKAPKDKNPSNWNLSVTTIGRFLKQQEQLTYLLNECRTIDLTETKVAISLTKLIKLRLGDTLRFFTYHIERHVLQAERVCREQNFITLKSNVECG
jgi:hypothetical protein